MSTAETGTDELRRSIRLVSILAAADDAGLAPLALLQLHSIAFFSNVLSPVWDIPPLSGSLLKRRNGPFYPPLQRDLDRLVGSGVAFVSNVAHVADEHGWRLEGEYRLNPTFGRPILAAISEWREEQRVSAFVREITLAISALPDDEIATASREDATYSDRNVDYGSVVDFAEWQTMNFSANAANELSRYVPGAVEATDAEKLHLYVRHLHTRLHGGR